MNFLNIFDSPRLLNSSMRIPPNFLSTSLTTDINNFLPLAFIYGKSSPYYFYRVITNQMKCNNLLSYCHRNCLQFVKTQIITGARVAQWVRSLDLTTHTSLSPIRCGFASGFVNYKKGALDSQPQVIKFTSCLPMVGGSLRLPPQLKLVAMI